MKLIVIAMAVALSAQAADTNAPPKAAKLAKGSPLATAAMIAKNYKDFKAGEIQIEVAHQWRTVAFEGYEKSLSLGGNYWLYEQVGFHAATGIRDLRDQFIDRVEFGLIGRVPVKKVAFLFGLGAEWQQLPEFGRSNTDVSKAKPKKPKPGEDDCDDKDPPTNPPTTPPGGKDPNDNGDRLHGGDKVSDWSVYSEIGVAARLNTYLEAFIKVRGVRPIDRASGEHIAIIAGSTYTF
jgi:hypothetical protein